MQQRPSTSGAAATRSGLPRASSAHNGGRGREGPAARRPAGPPTVSPGPRAAGAARTLLAFLAVATAALRVVWLTASVERDEAGYLMVASQWHHGISLYGNYWVDRPPLLIAYFAVAHLLGGIIGVRLLGCLLAGLTVLLAYGVGRAVGQSAGAALWPALAAAAFISTPLFGVDTVNGELIAVPLVLAGLVAVLRGTSGSGRARVSWWLTAGGAAAAAALVKQNFLDVFVFTAALAAIGWVLGRARPHVRLRDLGWFTLGAVGLTGVVLAGAAALGTSPGGLWDAVVVFRIRAAMVLGGSQVASTYARLEHYPRTLLVTGALLVLVALVVRLVLPPHRALVAAATATVLYEIASILAGAQFWAHYLVQLVPGLVLGTALATGLGSRPGRVLAALTRLAVGYAVVATLVALVATSAATLSPSRNQRVGEWLGTAARPGDQAVVLFGQPNILEVAGVSSPYPLLWSLPIRVEDPRLRTLTATLTGPRAPAWVLMDRRQGMSPARAATVRAALAGRYHRVVTVCGYRVYQRNGLALTVPAAPARCR